MSLAIYRRLFVLVLLLCPVLYPVVAQAHHAIVVGIDQYPSLQGANLEGCVNDARAIQTLLQKRGFNVTLLADRQANHDRILDELHKMQSTNGPGERFVFYYAGHGTHNARGDSILLPSDAGETDSPHTDIGQDDLYHVISAIPASSRAVLIDSCFAGGMMRALLRPGRALKARYYFRPYNPGSRPGERGFMYDKNLVAVNRQDRHEGSGTAGKLCYYVASRQNETAAEGRFDDGTHGVFTYYLVHRLTGTPTGDSPDARPTTRIEPVAKTNPGDLTTLVTGDVASYTEDIQHPMFSPDCGDRDPLSGEDVGPPSPNHTLWDDYNSAHPDSRFVDLLMAPDHGPLKQGDIVHISTAVHSTGYLVLLERGTDGSIVLLFPTSQKVEDAAVKDGDKVDIPDVDHDYSLKDPGTERLKAILFTSRQNCEALLNGFPPEHSIPIAGARNLELVATHRQAFYTSEIEFEVLAKATP